MIVQPFHLLKIDQPFLFTGEFDNQLYNVQGQTQFQARAGMNANMNRPNLYQKNTNMQGPGTGYMGSPGNSQGGMGNYMGGQQGNMYGMPPQQGMPGMCYTSSESSYRIA